MSDWTILYDAARQSIVDARYDDAERLLRQALDDPEVTEGERASLLRHLFDAVFGQGKLDEARRLAEDRVAAIENAPDADGDKLGTALMILGSVIAATHDMKRASAVFRRARKAFEAALGEWDPAVAECLRDHAAILVEHGRPEEAMPLFRRALTILETEIGPDTPEVAETLSGLGNCLAALDDFWAAKRYLRRALATSERLFGADAYQTARAAHDLAELFLDDEDWESALPLLHRALGTFEEDGLNSAEVADCLRDLAQVHSEMNEPELAFLHYRRALAIWEDDERNADRLPELYARFADFADAAGRADDATAARGRAQGLQRGEGSSE